jgi:hypothetical protein
MLAVLPVAFGAKVLLTDAVVLVLTVADSFVPDETFTAANAVSFKVVDGA